VLEAADAAIALTRRVGAGAIDLLLTDRDAARGRDLAQRLLARFPV
jgi:hypothetical protein